jgi:hypothetical protein
MTCRMESNRIDSCFSKGCCRNLEYFVDLTVSTINITNIKITIADINHSNIIIYIGTKN